jgi:hypothetical protein
VKVLVRGCQTLLEDMYIYHMKFAACMALPLVHFSCLYDSILYRIYVCMFCMLLFNFVSYVFFILLLRILIFMFMYFYCYICNVLCILFQCAGLCTVYV